MSNGSFWHVLMTLAGVVLPLLLAWALIGFGAGHRRRRRARRPPPR